MRRPNRWSIGAARGGSIPAVKVSIAAALILSGCAYRGGPIPYDNGASLTKPDPVAPVDAAYDVPLGPLDVVRVTVFRVPDLSGEFQVDTKGDLLMPLIGRVSVRDLRPDDLAIELQRRYGEKYLNDPEITVRVIATNSANITVEGGVAQAGIYALPGKTTLLGAIALARGVNPDFGNPRRVAIFRKQGGRTIAAAFDLVSIRRGQMDDPIVYPGDTVVVDSNELRQLYRDLIQTLPAIAIFRQL